MLVKDARWRANTLSDYGRPGGSRSKGGVESEEIILER